MSDTLSLCRDEDCPECGWPETYAEIDPSAETPGADAIGCRKCGWRVESIPESEWRWCGMPGHFIGARDCWFHLTTRVGGFRVSTVGDYFPPGRDEDGGPKPLGAGDRTYETYVFSAEDGGDCGNDVGVVADWIEIDSKGYADRAEAERGHMAMCRKYAAMPAVVAP